MHAGGSPDFLVALAANFIDSDSPTLIVILSNRFNRTSISKHRAWDRFDVEERKMNQFRSMRVACAAALGLSFAASVKAAPVVNGSYDAEYGVAAAVQQCPTGFGDSNTGQTGFANGS